MAARVEHTCVRWGKQLLGFGTTWLASGFGFIPLLNKDVSILRQRYFRSIRVGHAPHLRAEDRDWPLAHCLCRCHVTSLQFQAWTGPLPEEMKSG